MSSNVFKGYQQSPIWHIESLARCLNTSVRHLDDLASHADNLYREISQRKKDGTIRLCFDAAPQLKAIQQNINSSILRKVKFPDYIMGGVSDPDNPRDFLANARRHSGARILVNEDIASFFPSVTKELVFDIWRNYFGFSERVSTLLTALTTRKGVLPQGAKTSSYLANLAFWRTEPDFVRALSARGMTYTRWVDDATLSSRSDLSSKTLSQVLAAYFGMVKKSKLAVKRKKHKIWRAGKTMEVTGAIVGADRPTLGPKRKSRARALVHRCEVLASVSLTSSETTAALAQAANFVGQLGRAHPNSAQKLRVRLSVIKDSQKNARFLPQCSCGI